MAQCFAHAARRMMDAAAKGPFQPCCFDGAEYELATTIVDVHDRLVSLKGFNPKVTPLQREEAIGKVVSVVSSSFSSYFGCSPVERYCDIFEQIADFAARLSKDHIFHDGNKRTTVVMSLAFLHVAGVVLDIEDSEIPEDNEIYLWIQDVVTDGRTKEELAQDLRIHVIP